MKHFHDINRTTRANPDADMPDIEPLPAPEIIPAPHTGKWEGQTLDVLPGTYKASWILKSKEKGKYKGCKIRTYEFTFSKKSEKSMEGMNGEFTIHSRKSGASIRSKIDISVDQNNDGKYTSDEVLISSGKEGYRIRDAITDYTTYEFKDALNLRQLQKSGVFTFEISNISSSYYAPDIIFKNLSHNKNNMTSDSSHGNEFTINFIDYSMEEFIVC